MESSATRRRRPGSYERRTFIRRKSLGIPTAIRRINPRFVVTNMKQSPRWLYEKGLLPTRRPGNRIKELHYGMEIGRTSCTSFWANQFRVLMTAAAYY